jgi:hypothetical protein
VHQLDELKDLIVSGCTVQLCKFNEYVLSYLKNALLWVIFACSTVFTLSVLVCELCKVKNVMKFTNIIFASTAEACYRENL